MTTHCFHFVMPQESLPSLEAFLFAEYPELTWALQDADDHPIYEPLMPSEVQWPRSVVELYCDTQVTGKAIVSAIEAALALSLEVTETLIAESDWQNAWKAHYHAFPIADNFWVVPQHEDAPQAAQIILRMEPGLAFGSGTHETTFSTLQLIHRLPLENKTVCDYGCGSGILGIAAALLGARSVEAYDIDVQALEATAANARDNQVAEKIHICHKAEDIVAPCDAVFANILADTLMRLSDTLSNNVKPSGYLLLSGILASQAEAVLAAFPQFFCEQRLQKNDWVTFLLVKQ